MSCNVLLMVAWCVCVWGGGARGGRGGSFPKMRTALQILLVVAGEGSIYKVKLITVYLCSTVLDVG